MMIGCDFINNKNIELKPFLKWAGGKRQLLEKISCLYDPLFNKNTNKYIEPFVGGGAILFDILAKYELEKIYISDINHSLINTYLVIKKDVKELIKNLKELEEEFLKLNKDLKKEMYYKKRENFNNIINKKNYSIIKATLFIFLNKTCFNGLYRVNRKGLFNVPMGDYKNPKICDETLLINISKKLEKVDIICADYKKCFDYIDENTLVYFDPPYRPINSTSNFNTYTENGFSDDKQEELSEFIKKITKKNCKFILSNSDPKNNDENDNFFDDLYSEFNILRVDAKRNINSNGKNRGNIKEILINNI